MDDKEKYTDEKKQYPHLQGLLENGDAPGSAKVKASSWWRSELKSLRDDIVSIPKCLWSCKYVRLYVLVGGITGAVMCTVNVANAVRCVAHICKNFNFTHALSYGVSAAMVGIPYNFIKTVVLWPFVWAGVFFEDVWIPQASFSMPFLSMQSGYKIEVVTHSFCRAFDKSSVNLI